jgi:rare lipoprotein A
MAQWPRQPRSGNSENRASVLRVGTKYYIQLKNSSGSYENAFYLKDYTRATIIRDRLNSLFDDNPGADLDFITPSWENGCYVVVWSGVKWFQDLDVYTDTLSQGRTYENLYAGCYSDYKSYAYRSRSNVVLLATITNDDTDEYSVGAWELALTWANSIRKIVNGWNCTKDSSKESSLSSTVRTIPNLIVPTSSYTGNKTVDSSYYGAGEAQPNFYTANGDIFHCCDLTVARPKGTTWLKMNQWVKISYGNKSVVARVTDSCGTDKLDLSSGGVAYALECYGGETVTCSAP